MGLIGDDSRKVALDRDALAALAESYGTPLYVYDGDHLRRHLANLKQLLSTEIADLLYFEPANRAPAVLDVFRELGFGAVAVSRRGVDRLRRLGFVANSIQWSGFGYSDADLGFIASDGISANLGTSGELERAAVRFPGLEVGVSVDVASDPANKKGIPPNDLLRIASSLQLVVRRIHGYVGTGVLSEARHLEHARYLGELVARLPLSMRASIREINVSGGYGHDYGVGSAFEWARYATDIRNVHVQICADLGMKIRLQLEVGRAAVVSSGVLLTRVVDAFAKGSSFYVVVDTNVSQFPRPLRYPARASGGAPGAGGQHRALLLGQTGNEREGAQLEATLVGNSHYSRDRLGALSVADQNPEKLRGAYVVLLDAGAYCEAMMDNWLDQSPPRSCLVQTGQAEVVW